MTLSLIFFTKSTGVVPVHSNISFITHDLIKCMFSRSCKTDRLKGLFYKIGLQAYLIK